MEDRYFFTVCGVWKKVLVHWRTSVFRDLFFFWSNGNFHLIAHVCSTIGDAVLGKMREQVEFALLQQLVHVDVKDIEDVVQKHSKIQVQDFLKNIFPILLQLCTLLGTFAGQPIAYAKLIASRLVNY